MKRLLRRLLVGALAAAMLATLGGCDLAGTLQKSGLAPLLTKHRFGVSTGPGPAALPRGGTAGSAWPASTPDND